MKGTAGVPRLVGAAGLRLSGLAISPVTGELWGTAGDTVCTINRRTGSVTIVGGGTLGTAHSSIAFSPLGGLYGLYDNALVRIDRGTGEATVLNLTGVTGLQCIAMRSDLAAVGVPPDAAIPQVAELLQNYPNPCNGMSKFGFRLSTRAWVDLRVYDLLGKEVAVLVSEDRAPGEYAVLFDAAGLASGLYLYRITAGSFVRTRKMILTR
jgi:hypothetical protein